MAFNSLCLPPAHSKLLSTLHKVISHMVGRTLCMLKNVQLITKCACGIEGDVSVGFYGCIEIFKIETPISTH